MPNFVDIIDNGFVALYLILTLKLNFDILTLY